MRPLRLTVAGLRSYRTETTVEFRDRRLVAVIGDTGAGKSSLLEAITYALYGASTWSAQAGDLVSHGAKVMRVELEFLADDKVWTVTRAMPAGSYPPPVHHLEGPDGTKVDGRNEVNAAIRDLVGLDLDGFLRSVILPQGRFDLLLKATRTERLATLKNIFRVDELERARERARALRDELRPKLERLEAERARYPADPEATVAEAARRAEAARSSELRLDGARRAVAAAEGRRGEATAERARVGRVLDALSEAVGAAGAAELAADLAELVSQAATFEQALAAADAEAERARAVLGNATAALDERASAGLDAASLARARAQVDRVGDAGRRVAELAAELSAAQAALGAAELGVREVAAELDRVADEAGRAKAAVAPRAESANAAQQTLVAARRAFDAATSALGQWERAVDAAAAAAGAAAASAERTDEAGRDEREAATAERAAVEALAACDRADSVAHLAHGLGGGDACPVCAQPLPSGFAVPEPAGRAEAVAALAAARARAERAVQAARRVEAERSAAAALREATERTVREVTGEAAAAEATLRAVLDAAGPDGTADRPGPPGSGAAGPTRGGWAGGTGDARALAALVAEAGGGRLAALDAAGAAARASLDEARQAAGAAAEQLALVRERARAAERDLDERRARVAELTGARTRVVADLVVLLDELEPAWPIGGADVVRAAAGEAPRPGERAPGSAELGAAVAALDAGRARAALAEAERVLGELATARAQADAAVQATQARRDELRRERDGALERPSRVAIARAQTLAGALGSARAALGADAAPAEGGPEAGAGLDEWASWSAAAVVESERLLATAGTAVEQARRAVATAEAEAAEALAAVEVGDADELQASLVAAVAERTSAAEALVRAEDELPVAAELDRRVSAGTAFVDTVELVRTRLADGAFVGSIIARRQQALLGVASTILAETTGGRFGFTDDFEIFDRLSGRARSPRTLSGGETFLASLALALGMVELAARAGGRLDALFLDEGFGALDAASLDAAVDALERRADEGRLVVAISHVGALARRIGQDGSVLAVVERNGASELAWTSGPLDGFDDVGVDADLRRTLSGLLEA